MGETLNWRALEIVDLRSSSRNEELLLAFYRQIYLPAFPIKSERQTPSIWKRLLWDNNPHTQFHLLVAGEHLDSPRKRRLYGGRVFEYFPNSGCGLNTYLAVNPECRGQGLGTHLFELGLRALKCIAWSHGRRLKAVFAEVNDPRKVGELREVMNPWRRLAYFVRLGGRVVDIPYVQPELAPGQGRARSLLLLLMHQQGRRRSFVQATLVRDFLYDLFRVCGVPAPETDADFRKMLRAMPRPQVRLLGTPKQIARGVSRLTAGSPSSPPPSRTPMPPGRSPSRRSASRSASSRPVARR